MFGIYLWEYSDDKNKRPMDSMLFKMQVKHYFSLLKENKIEGVIFCSSTVGDAELETNEILKRYISEHGNKEIKDTF